MVGVRPPAAAPRGLIRWIGMPAATRQTGVRFPLGSPRPCSTTDSAAGFYPACVGSNPTRGSAMSLSSKGSGYEVLILVIGVRIPVGTPPTLVVQRNRTLVYETSGEGSTPSEGAIFLCLADPGSSLRSSMTVFDSLQRSRSKEHVQGGCWLSIWAHNPDHVGSIPAPATAAILGETHLS